MSRLRKTAVTALGFSALIVVLFLASPVAMNAIPSDKDVRVVNTTMEPVPVLNMSDARQPFQVGAVGTQNGTNVSTLTVATVPVGKRLVIEFVSMSGQVPPGQHVELFHITTSAGPFGGATHDFLVNPQPDAVIGDALFRASQQVRLYADPGTTVTATFRRNSSAGLTTYGATISGYLVDL
ncbi:MAG TPA: hypothetical protein VLV78_18165 [Thermoanaerobaculia bacterium]|nr:hypothetical protein [Thermoanaerobaculia bacterium]